MNQAPVRRWPPRPADAPDAPGEIPPDPSGAGMDRIVPRGFLRRAGPFLVLAAAVLMLAPLIWRLRPAVGSVQAVSGDGIDVAAVSRRVFEDFIPVRGQVTPAHTFYLDTAEGGRVESVHVEDGAHVATGDLLIVLSNSQLQLDVISREAEVAQQQNNLRIQELQFERDRLNHSRSLIDVDHQIEQLTERLSRYEPLAAAGAASPLEVEEMRQNLDYYQRIKDLTIDARDTDERLMRSQIEQIRVTNGRLESNLEAARKNLEDLNVRAPAAGVLTDFSVELGQSLPRNQRIGQIDTPSEFKLVASIDEFYLSRVQTGQRAGATVNGDAFDLRIGRIDPTVSEGQFEAEIFFEGAQPAELRRGQSLQLRLYVGESEETLTLPNGPFLQETGGNWAYVLSEDESTAVRRTIRTGRRNSQLVEVVDGLEEGERVVVSAYSSFGNVERLKLK